MVATVSRHPLPTGNAEAGLAVLQESADGWIDSLEADSTGLGDAFDTSPLLTKGHCLLDPQEAIFLTWGACVNAMQIACAMFASTTTTEDHVQCRIAAQGPHHLGQRPSVPSGTSRRSVSGTA
ncbi:hypothetical protein EES39_05250 [Streptomyces sp. ADI92-24]|uniref:hypothetical protein n=1 Tax=unclassified Streptomyces TaxID=2593676 RepID=UPI000F49166B|nr:MULTISPECIES: hypothetical protein [unclassified Streptomyces]MCX4772460.1 hypothetical protein [Streptomyces sp. NBC_01285]ROQ71568.1 hypothetical protein EDD95_7684 [Streptomyces sp. CEV 2-1]RPK50823.1 hypothetical protein EES39_05250 [Streptomyces sp. ADI92-24]